MHSRTTRVRRVGISEMASCSEGDGTEGERILRGRVGVAAARLRARHRRALRGSEGRRRMRECRRGERTIEGVCRDGGKLDPARRSRRDVRRDGVFHRRLEAEARRRNAVGVQRVWLARIERNGGGKSVDFGNESSLKRRDEGGRGPDRFGKSLTGGVALSGAGSVEAVFERRFLGMRRLVEKRLLVDAVGEAEGVEVVADDADAG